MFKQLFGLVLGLLLMCSTQAATVVIKVSQFPNITALESGDLLLVARAGNTNYNISWDQLIEQIGTNGAPEQFITNLFIVNVTSNYMLFSTNIYEGDTIVSNYFQTNVFQDTYMSNYFQTNQIFYETNLYLTEISTTNFIDYINNEYVSNFFETNIFFVDNSVSNYFTTNYFPLYQITSNYIFNVAWQLTNATLYGTTTFSPVSGNLAGYISIKNNGGVEKISLAASNSTVSAGSGVFTTLTSGSFVAVGAGGLLINTQAVTSTLLDHYFETNTLTSVTANITNLVVRDGIGLGTNYFAGPTNTVAMNLQEQYYVTYTPVSVTGLENKSNNIVQAVVITVTNAATTNVSWTLPAGLVIPERTNQVTISNASQGILSMRYSPLAGTNGVYRQF